MSSLSTSSERDLESLQKELKWIRVQGKEDDLSSFEKLKKKCLENPVVPIGSVATVGALSYGVYCMFIGDSKTQQLMMRCRVLAQGFTIGAIAFGVFFVQFQKKNKNTNI